MSEPDTTDSVELFAAALRQLRADNGNPTLEALARTTGVSKSVLSEAFAGRKLPSERTVSALAGAFRTDARTLADRRQALEPDPSPAGQGGASPRRRGRLATIAVAAAVGLVIGVVAGAGTTYAIVHGPAAQSAHAAGATGTPRAAASDAPKIAVRTGTDPANTKCVNDAKVVASETRTNNTQLQIIYSNACHAAWSRVTRYDGQATGNEVSTSIYRQIAPHASDRQDTTEPDTQSAYTTLIVRPTPNTELCAVGSITLNGTTISLGEPVCL